MMLRVPEVVIGGRSVLQNRVLHQQVAKIQAKIPDQACNDRFIRKAAQEL